MIMDLDCDMGTCPPLVASSLQKLCIGDLVLLWVIINSGVFVMQQANTVMIGMVGIAAILMVIPFKYVVMAATLYLFATTSKASKNVMANDTGNRRLKEWWDSIPIVTVELVNEPPKDR